jgi:hypothetical protein
MQDRAAPTVASAPAPAGGEAGATESAGAAPGVAPLATASSAGPSASEQAYGAGAHDLPSGHFDQPEGGHGGHHHIQMIAVHGATPLRDAHGHPLVDQAGKPITMHGQAAVQAMNAPLGHGGTALYYVWGHMCHPAVAGSGYVHGGDLAHAPKQLAEDTADVKHLGLPAPLSGEHFVASPQQLPDAFAFKKHPSQGTFADYGAGGRTHSEQAEVGGEHKGVMYMTWNVPDRHAGRGAGITHGMLTAGDHVTRCRVEPRTMKSVDQPGTAVWWYVHAKLHGASVYGWVLAEADVGGQKIHQLTPTG